MSKTPTDNRTHEWRRLAADYLLAAAGLGVLTWFCLWVGLDFATAAFAYLILVVLFASWCDGGASIALAVAAAGCLGWFFTAPDPTRWISGRPEALPVILFLMAFLVTALFIWRSRRRVAAAAGARNALEAAFRASKVLNDQLQIVIDTIPAMVWATRPDGSAEFVNRRWLEYTGLSRDKALDWGWIAAIHPEDLIRLQDNWRATIASGETGESEARIRRADGEYRRFLFRAVPLRDQAGRIVKWYGTNTDIEYDRRAERSQRAEQELRAAIDSIPAIAWTTRPDGLNDFHNQRLLSYTRLSPEDLRGDGWTKMFHPDDLAAYVEKWRVAVTTGTSFESEGRLRRYDGQYRWFLARAEPRRDERGGIVKWYGTHIDIDDRKRTEQALRRSEAYLTEAQRLSQTGSLGWITASGALHWSEQIFRILGYDSAVKPSVDLVLQRVHPDDVAMVRRAIDLACRGEQDLDLTHRLLMPDGSVKFVHVLSRPVSMPNNHEIAGALMDVTAAKQVEQALRENEQRLRDYAETASDWIWESGPDHRFTHVTDRVMVIDMEPAPTIGKRRWDLAACIEDEPEKWRHHKAVLDAHRPFRGFTYTVALGDGSFRYVSVSGKPVFDDAGQFIGYRGVGTDVTASVRADLAERALQQAQAELSHVTRVTTLGGLAASIAHEVNQPLSAIVANGEATLQWLCGETPDSNEARIAVERIIADAHRASAVIRRTRELSRRSKSEKQRLDINGLIEETMSLVRREAASNHVSLQLELAPGLPVVHGDRVQLQQVIINLVVNGIEAMATITGTQRELLIRSRRHEDSRVLVAVEDCGAGIDPEHADKLFDAFFTTKPAGLGMGLSICQSIIEAHGGRMWASANIGPGTSFQFTLNADGEPVS